MLVQGEHGKYSPHRNYHPSWFLPLVETNIISGLGGISRHHPVLKEKNPRVIIHHKYWFKKNLITHSMIQ